MAEEDERAKQESLHACSPGEPERQCSNYIENCEPKSEGHRKNVHEDQWKSRCGKQLPVLVVGHYCHDCIRLVGGASIDALGGSASYISNVLDALSVKAHVVSKVGGDFEFISQVSHPPLILEEQHTTQFFADYTTGKDRVLRVGKVCEQILSSDIPLEGEYSLGLAVGVAGEITISVIERMLKVSQRVIVDLQALIRRIDSSTGDVNLQHIRTTPFDSILNQISFLKATRAESAYIDLDSARQVTCVLVTDGKHGSTVYQRDKEYHVPPFATEEVDPTGAGDSFLAGFVAGLYRGFPVQKAVLMGNYFGALAVSQIGIPQLKLADLEELQEIFYGVEEQEINCNLQTDSSETADRFHTSQTSQIHP
ncbi:hypothetical protein O6H91_06G032200 [Diphasiastrum complanatum]|uniref:Uncharacterized protein n=2 Tax=Diphasiastrum complanatum TaxID=34168 RepID=A0ACC2DD02_DIPCM|nr:hypothetical protein O6H91_06G031100 [Diphasiastrum complanatum]KAJ7551852.1 hypothetical protein O6H91_06G032200 [Diphasiastrum complanatum]